jgi:hypothetical protein
MDIWSTRPPAHSSWLPVGFRTRAANPGPLAARYLVIFSPAGLERWFLDVARLVEVAKPEEPDPIALRLLAQRYGIVPAE